jgi:hypothetical protein
LRPDAALETFETLAAAVGDAVARTVLTLLGGEYLPLLATVESAERRKALETILQERPRTPLWRAAREAGVPVASAYRWMREGALDVPRPTAAAGA